MGNQLGCNTLLPFGRLANVAQQFGVEAQKESLRIIRDTGFDACEFSHYECLALDECRVLHEHCRHLGLQSWSAHSWVPVPGDAAEATAKLPAQLSSLDGASALGARVMVVHAPRGTCDLADAGQRCARRDALGMTLNELSTEAVKRGLTVAIENCGDREDLEFLVATVAELDLAGIGFNIDTGHAVIHGMTPAEAIQLMGGRLCTTHLQDNFGRRDDHLPPGEGGIDWPETLAALKRVGYCGTLMVEISDCPPGRDPAAAEDTRTAYRNLSRFAAAV